MMVNSLAIMMNALIPNASGRMVRMMASGMANMMVRVMISIMVDGRVNRGVVLSIRIV